MARIGVSSSAASHPSIGMGAKIKLNCEISLEMNQTQLTLMPYKGIFDYFDSAFGAAHGRLVRELKVFHLAENGWLPVGASASCERLSCCAELETHSEDGNGL